MKALLMAACGGLVLTASALLAPAAPAPEPLPLDGSPWTGPVDARVRLKFAKDGVAFTTSPTIEVATGDFVVADQSDGRVFFTGSNFGGWSGAMHARSGDPRFYDFILDDGDGGVQEKGGYPGALRDWAAGVYGDAAGFGVAVTETSGDGSLRLRKRDTGVKMRQTSRSSGDAFYDGATRRFKGRFSFFGALDSFAEN